MPDVDALEGQSVARSDGVLDVGASRLKSVHGSYSADLNGILTLRRVHATDVSNCTSMLDSGRTSPRFNGCQGGSRGKLPFPALHLT